ncbi:MAG: hypothetical protein QOG63_2240 [Thermoleophilaceae bacterium]|jgi:hypothetical protein|nr:hypothetical protein [Thermoleophilaceae bacterium]
MAEVVDTQPGGLREGVTEGAKELREQASRDNIESKLDDAVSERPLVKHMLDLRNVLKALAVAAVLTLIVSLLLSPKLGALILVVSFGIAWAAFASRDYNRRRPTKPADEGDDA